VTTALSISGFSAETFVFLGFPPRGGQARQAWLNDLSEESRVCVFFEAPHFIERTAREARSACINRPILVISELTKIHERLAVTPIDSGPADLTGKGEFVVVIGPKSMRMRSDDRVDFNRDAELLYDSLTSRAQTDEEAIQLTSKALGIADQAVRKIIKKHKISVKRHTESVP
jgi:16S rRNA C1402 (ribose-2'-O) methylase RsmI